MSPFLSYFFLFLRLRLPPKSTSNYTLVPYTTLCRSVKPLAWAGHRGGSTWTYDHADRRRRGPGPRTGSPERSGRSRSSRRRHPRASGRRWRSEEPTSELQSLMSNSYAVLRLTKKKQVSQHSTHNHTINRQDRQA